MRVLDHDDGGVHQRADGDGDPPQGHDVGVDPLPGHDKEGGEHADRQGEDDHQGRTEVDQEDDADQGDDEAFYQQLVTQIVDGPFDQARAVVGRDDLHALRQTRLERLQLLLDVPDHLQGVLAVPHDDDAADDLPLAVPFRQSPPKFRSCRDPGDLVKEDGRPESVYAQGHVLQVLHGLDVAQPADHVLGLRHFHDPAAHVVVAPLDRRLDPVERYVVDQQLVGVDLHLVLLDEPADAGDLGHPDDRGEFVPEEPVLDAPQFRQVVPVAPEHVLVDPAHARGVGPERGVHARRQAVGHVAQVLQHAAAGPVEVRAVLEDDVHEAEPEETVAADRLCVGHREHGRGQGVGHLVLHHLGRLAGILGQDDHLHVREVRDGVERDLHQGHSPARDQQQRDQDHQEPVPDGVFDYALQHDGFL